MRLTVALLAMSLLTMGDTAASAQGPRGVPRMSVPEVPQREREAADEPMFRAEVTRVEGSALVLDRNGKPVRGLTVADFDVLENGVPQVVRSFVPFTFAPDVLVLPEPVLERADADAAPVSMPASNYYTSASRVFALILDDLHVDVRRTKVARDAARRLVEQLDPSDLLLVVQTGSGESTGFFTRDRTHALQVIEGFTGQRLLDRTLHAKRMRVPLDDSDAERLEHYRRMCERLRDVSLALREVTGRRKTLVLVSEGSSYGAGMSDMEVRMPTAASGRVNAGSGSLRLMNELLSAAAASNVAIYPLNPNGLDVPDADLIQVSGLQAAPTEGDYSQMLMEARQSREMGRDLAALTGGVSLVDTNDPLAGIDRAVQDASSHYVLTYEPERPAKGSEYRTIDVKVRRPGVTVLARRGYRAPGVRPPPAMKVPGSLPPQLRTLLAGVMPDDGLPIRVQAVPLIRKGRTTTVAVVVEVNGTVLAGEQGVSTLRVEQGLLTVNGTGKADNGTRRTFDAALSPVQQEVLAVTGLRSIWAVDLVKGRHQLRVATIDLASGRGGSVYVDVDVSDDDLPPGMLVASRFLSMMPTVFTDQRLERWTGALPTATRVFPQGDVLTVTVPHAAATPATARLSCPGGQVVWKGDGAPLEGAQAVQFVVPLDAVRAPVCDLTVDTSAGRVATTLGIVFPQQDPVKP